MFDLQKQSLVGSILYKIVFSGGGFFGKRPTGVLLYIGNFHAILAALAPFDTEVCLESVNGSEVRLHSGSAKSVRCADFGARGSCGARGAFCAAARKVWNVSGMARAPS